MKKLTIIALVILALVSFIPAANAKETTCKGDAQSSTPPVPNYPTYIRNVVWRNTRALCLAEQSQVVSHSSQAPTTSQKKVINQKLIEQKTVN